ncbi:Flap endonuclease 1-A [Colletotrichum trifolii]|uniref:Flap endonuclease 1-A n=1 Tax=Colletotrichum trifolii TaxID=5466 RepID=A0A4R8Q3K7_COLTR|nr:Flap endonuclease 1-A [Colletotrichum trifolii]
MGIKGIYRELGPGRRVSLARLATEHLESSDRPLRLAVDIAIWQFQTQAARGGTNPAIRTLFYRLVRLLGLGIHPIFVFDGPHKPAFKRNRRSGRGDGVTTAMTKRLIRLFGFPVHDAPGEAEAECALLQQKGIVDAVLSEDVDTIMFGCTRTLRNWTAEGVRGPKTPTHVTLYDVNELVAAGTGLDRQGMVADAIEVMEREEMALVKRVSGRRRHHSTDGIPELRVVYVPAEIVKLDMSNEVDEALSIDRHGLALNSDDGFDIAVAGGEDSGGHNRTGAKHIYDPTIPDSVWLPESLVKLSIPLMVEDWEEKQRAKAMRPATNGVSRVKNIKAPQHLGALDQWLQLTRGVAATTAANTVGNTNNRKVKNTTPDFGSEVPSPAHFKRAGEIHDKPNNGLHISQRPSPLRGPANRSKQSGSNGKATAAEPAGHKNPWAYAGSQDMPRITKSQQSSEPTSLPSEPVRPSLARGRASLTTSLPSLVVDLSGSDDDWLPKGKSIGCIDQPSVAGCEQPSFGGGTHAASPDLVHTSLKNTKPKKQTRIDPFVNAPLQGLSASSTLDYVSHWKKSEAIHHVVHDCISPKDVAIISEKPTIGRSPADRKLTERTGGTLSEDNPSTQKRIMPRKSACGFFKIVGIDEEDHSSITLGALKPQRIPIIDLTGDDRPS